MIQEGGDVVAADQPLWEANNVRVDEAALTGESIAVVKRVEPVDGETALAWCAALLLAAVYAPGLSTVLRTRAPGTAGWLCVMGMSLLSVLIGQVFLVVRGLWRAS